MSFGMVAASYFAVANSGNDDSAYHTAVMQDSPLAFYKFDETSGTVMADSSGNGRNGTYSAGVDIAQYPITSGSLGQSAVFPNNTNDTSDYRATVSYGAWMDASEFTVVFTCFLEPLGYYRLIADRYGEPGNDWSWYVYGHDGTVRFYYRSSGGVNTGIDTGFTPIQGVRYCIAAYVNASESGIRIYDDNGLAAQATGAGGAVNASSRALTLMNAETGHYTANGWLDDLAVFGAALSTTRLDELAGLALASTAKWINRAAGVSLRNGTVDHTITFPAASAGSLLVAIISSPDASTMVTPGWTKRVSQVGDTELAVYTRSANAGDTSVQLSLAASNSPLHYVVYEFPTGSAWYSSVGSSYSGSYPDLTGLPSVPVTVFAVMSMRRVAIDNPGGATLSWRYFWKTDFDQETLNNGVTNGVFTNVGYISDLQDVAASATTFTESGTANTQKCLFAVSIP